MKKVKIKICGIKEESILNCCVNNKIDFYGLIFYKKSPRYINLEKASNLINFININKDINAVGVFVNHSLDDIIKTINKLNLNFIQLHGNEDNNFIIRLKENFDLKIIKAIGINNEKDLKKTDLYPNSDFFLFDYKAKKNELPGGNAKSFDWSMIKNQKFTKPWFISGGINVENINYILNNLNPYGIDISSGVEDSPGIKNEKKILKIREKINA